MFGIRLRGRCPVPRYRRNGVSSTQSLVQRQVSPNEKAVSNGSRAPIRGAAIMEHDRVARHRTDPHPRPNPRPPERHRFRGHRGGRRPRRSLPPHQPGAGRVQIPPRLSEARQELGQALHREDDRLLPSPGHPPSRPTPQDRPHPRPPWQAARQRLPNAATPTATSPCSPRSTKPTAISPDPPPRSCRGACSTSTETHASSAPPTSPTATSTTSASAAPTVPDGSPAEAPRPRPYPSPLAATRRQARPPARRHRALGRPPRREGRLRRRRADPVPSSSTSTGPASSSPRSLAPTAGSSGATGNEAQVIFRKVQVVARRRALPQAGRHPRVA